MHPNSRIIVWYDNASEEAVRNSGAMLAEKGLGNVTFIDVQTLHSVSEIYLLLGHRKIPVYYKVDLYKLMITREMLQQKPNELFVFSDFDLHPLTQEQLFDQETKEKIRKFNLVFTSKGHRGFENSFHIMKYDADLVESLKYIIDYCVLVAKEVNRNLLARISAQMVYDVLANNFFKIYYLKKRWVEGSRINEEELYKSMKNQLENLSSSRLSADRFLFNAVKKIANDDLLLSNMIAVTVQKLIDKEDVRKLEDGVFEPRSSLLFKDGFQISKFYLNERPKGESNDIPVLSPQNVLGLVSAYDHNDRLPVPGKNIEHEPGINYY